MNWLNLFIPNLRSAEFSNSEPAARATWLSVLAYCCEQENGGVIRDAEGWSDRAWLQNCGVTATEAQNAAPLVAFVDGNATVWNYPEDREKEVQSKRQAGARGGLAKTQAKTQAAKINGAKGGRPKTEHNREDMQQEENPSETEAEPKQEPKGIGKELEKEEKTKIVPQISERGFAFAEWFKTLIPQTTKPENGWRENWARCYDEMIRLDNRTPAQIAKVCQWARQDGFWAKNFLSPTKLRKSNKDGVNYFDVLSANAAPAQSPLTAMPTATADPEGWIEYLDRRNAPHTAYATARGWMREEFHAGWKPETVTP